MVINCKDKAVQIKTEVKERVRELVDMGKPAPKLTIIRVGDDYASERYAACKVKDCKECGIDAKVVHFGEDITTERLCLEVLREQRKCDAIIVQLPLPKHIDAQEVTRHILPSKDVDGLSEHSHHKPCTPLAVMCILKEVCKLNLENKNVLMIGRSKLVGMPLFMMLQKENANVTLCHSKTSHENLVKHAEDSEIIISAVGKENVLEPEDIALGAYVIDVGINRDANGKLCGDIAESEYYEKTPVPNGVGLLTRAMLLRNVLAAYE